MQRLTESRNPQTLGSWHSNAELLAFTELVSPGNFDLMILPIRGDERSGWKPGIPTPIVNTSASELEPAFSRDGRWLAYVSNTSGSFEVYVRRYPEPGGPWQVSNGGGNHPTWSRVKQELFFSASSKIMKVPYVVEGESFRADKPRPFSEARFGARTSRMFDLDPGGERFAIAPVSDVKRDHVAIVLNFFDELRRLAADKH